MNSFFDWAFSLSPWEAAFWLLIANIATFALAVLPGIAATNLFRRRQIVAPPGPLQRKEVVYTAAGVVINWLITIAAWVLWRLRVPGHPT